MKTTQKDAAVLQSKSHFNYNKLQAAACMLCSAATSIALIYWAVRSIL